MHALGHHRSLFWWSRKAAEESEARSRELDDVTKTFSKTRETENVVNMSWWSTCADVLGLSRSREKEALGTAGPVSEFAANAIKIAAGRKKDENNYFKTLYLFPSAYTLRIYHAFFGYIADDAEKRLVDGIFILSLWRLDVWSVTAVRCFAEQETRSTNCQRLYAGTFGASINFAAAQVVGQTIQCVELCDPEEPQTRAEGEHRNDRNTEVLGMESRATVVVHCNRVQVNYTAAKSGSFAEYTETEIKKRESNHHESYLK